MDYDTLHKQLAEEFGIETGQVRAIRSLMIGDSRSIEEIIEWGINKSESKRSRGGLPSKGCRRKPKEHYLEIVRFLKEIEPYKLERLLVDIKDI